MLDAQEGVESAESGSSKSRTCGSVIKAHAPEQRAVAAVRRKAAPEDGRRIVESMSTKRQQLSRPRFARVSGASTPFILQTEGNIVAHAQMGKKRIALEHHRGAAFRWRQMRDIAPAQAGPSPG